MARNPEGSGGVDPTEHVVQHSDELSSNWERTLQDMRAMADDRADRGFETLAIPAGDTTTLSPDMSEDDRWGLAHIVPKNYADDFEALYEDATFDETGVYQTESGGFVFVVTECIDLDAEVVVFVAGAYDARFAGGLVRTATDRGKMYTHVRKLDHTHLGTIEHDDESDFFPDPEAILAYDVAGDRS